MSHLPVLQDKVLPTLNQDGSRLQIRPQLFAGRLYRARQVVGWGLIALFVGLPFVRIGGKPAMFLDVAHRQFTFFGTTFLATDGVLLMFLMLSLFVSIIALTALLGRAWCGWGCPQTVYMEFLFRPIERLFEGDRNAQLRRDKHGGGIRRVLKNVVFAGLSVFVANVFLAYFVSTDVLFQWMAASPLEHPGGFAVMGVTAGLVFFDFAVFREQMCTVICPYARLQAALFDKDSLVIGYDEKRGEPRRKGKSQADGSGDCIDCDACVRTCPTGIDIREGLQLECIACAQCIDACNTIMAKVNRPPNLIGYASQRTLEGGKKKVLRPRVFAYGALLAVLLTALTVVANSREGADITILRGIGAPFVVDEAGVRNQVRLKIDNRQGEEMKYPFEVLVPDGERLVPAAERGLTVIAPENPLVVPGEGRQATSFFVLSPAGAFQDGRLPIVVRVQTPNGKVVEKPYHLLGPQAD